MARPFARLFPGLTGRKGVIESILPRRTFADVILPPATLRMLDEALTQVHSYGLIFDDWGLGERHPTGTALAFNFAGPSGTGKTICAEAIAHELRKRLLLVHYAELESMWFGETPKNVAAVFRLAREDDAVLFFDEADAIAGRRSTDMSQGMQRETNTTVNVLLQELERFDGVVIFATNLAANFDPAFERRVRTHVLFELPGLEEREQIWRVQLHRRTPLATDVDFRALAERYQVTGGDIRNAVLKAALAAAAEEGPDEWKRIHQHHFIRGMEEVVAAKAVMKQSIIESPQQHYEAALQETRSALNQMRSYATVTAAAAGAALIIALLSLFLGGCVQVREDADDDGAVPTSQPTGAAPAPPPPAVADSLRGLRFLIDISDRKLYVMNATDTLRVEDVAVGTQEHPTPTGEWTIKRVDFNPDWTPPPGEEWTEDKEPQDPGAPNNPMGRARLVFQEPYTIHGTAAGASLGKAESHGSIRVSNVAVLQLARMVLEAGGAVKPESFYQDAMTNATVMQKVDVPNPVPITIRD